MGVGLLFLWVAILLSLMFGLLILCFGTLRSLRNDIETMWTNPSKALDRMRRELDDERQHHAAEQRMSARVINMQLQTIKELEAQIAARSIPSQGT